MTKTRKPKIKTRKRQCRKVYHKVYLKQHAPHNLGTLYSEATENTKFLPSNHLIKLSIEGDMRFLSQEKDCSFCCILQHICFAFFPINLETSAGCSELLMDPVLGNKIRNHEKFNTTDSLEYSMILYDVILKKSGSRTQLSFYVKNHKRIWKNLEIFGTQRKGQSRRNSTFRS